MLSWIYSKGAQVWNVTCKMKSLKFVIRIQSSDNYLALQNYYPGNVVMNWDLPVKKNLANMNFSLDLQGC